MLTLAQIDHELMHRTLYLEKARAEDEPPKILAMTDAMFAFLAIAVRQVSAEVKALQDLQEMAAAVQAALSGHLQEIIEASHVEEVAKKLKPKAKAGLRATYTRGARIGAEDLAAVNITVRFDIMNPLAEQWAERNAARLVTEIDEDQRNTVRTIVTEAVGKGRTPQQVAMDVRNAVGLHSRQAKALERYRGTLDGKRLDGKLTETQVNKKVERYAKALLRQRSETIARSEILRSAHAGQRGLWDEAGRSGLLDRQVTMIEWIYTQDDLVCEQCIDMDGETIEMNGSWEFPDGRSSPIPNDIHPNCRCSQGIATKG